MCLPQPPPPPHLLFTRPIHGVLVVYVCVTCFSLTTNKLSNNLTEVVWGLLNCLSTVVMAS